MSNQTIREILITPEKAQEMLLKNNKNRNFNKLIIKNYAELMSKGFWKRNTFELIKLNADGEILDGQHRLMAVVRSGVPTYFHVAENLDNNIFDVLDTGKKRIASDVFQIQGVKNSNCIPSIIRLYDNLKRQRMSNDYVSNVETLNIYESNEDFWQEVARLSLNYYSRYSKLLTPQEIGGFMAYIAEFYSLKDATLFFEDLASSNNSRTSAVNILTRKLFENKVNKVNKLSNVVKKAFILKTFKYWILKVDVKVLKFADGVDEFPFLKKVK